MTERTSPQSAIYALEQAVQSLAHSRSFTADKRTMLVRQAEDGINMIRAIAPYDPADIREFILAKRRQAE